MPARTAAGTRFVTLNSLMVRIKRRSRIGRLVSSVAACEAGPMNRAGYSSAVVSSDPYAWLRPLYRVGHSAETHRGTWLLKATLFDGNPYSVWVSIRK